MECGGGNKPKIKTADFKLNVHPLGRNMSLKSIQGGGGIKFLHFTICAICSVSIPGKFRKKSVLLPQVLFAEITHLLIPDVAGLSKIRLLIHPLNVTPPEMK